MKKIIIGLCLSLTTAFVFARNEPMRDPIEEPVGMTVSGNASKTNLKKALLAAGIKLGWVVQEEKDGSLVAMLSVRKHTVTVGIKYDTEKFVVTYRDSVNLDYEIGSSGPEIHPNYHKWITNLLRETRTQLALVR